MAMFGTPLQGTMNSTQGKALRHCSRCATVRPRIVKATASSPSSVKTEVADVVVVGSGVIGLCVAHQILQSTDLSVALLDRQQPCAGATGAGQGYLWMCHRDPSSPTWPLAVRGKQLWRELAANNKVLAEAMEWQPTGSLLLATCPEEKQQVEARAAMLGQQQVQGVSILSRQQMEQEEPALSLPPGSTGLAVESDAQLNGKATAWALLDDCKRLGCAGSSRSSSSESTSRCRVFFQEDVTAVESLGPGQGAQVVTSQRRLQAKVGVVVSAGAWSGRLLAAATGESGWLQLFQPRRGHLLELPPPPGMAAIRHGIMELAYTKHYSRSEQQAADAIRGSTAAQPEDVDITFTATTSKAGTLLIGSSREFSGWEQVSDASIVRAIMDRAAGFLPDLATVAAACKAGPPEDMLARVGLRPFAVGGLPAIGWVPGLPGVMVAAGHEGSGLCLGPATAELLMKNLLAGGGSDQSCGHLDPIVRLKAVPSVGAGAA